MTDDQRGIVLDETTAELVRDSALLPSIKRADGHPVASSLAHPGDILTHIGGRPVAELVAAHDQAKAYAKELRGLSKRGPVTQYVCAGDFLDYAEHLDHLADMLIAPELVAAWHAQHDGTSS